EGFSIEKSTDGIHFQAIDFLKGKGNSNERLQYSFLDGAAREAAYYRLKQVDWDGDFAYSSILHVAASRESFLTIYPNPVHDQVMIIGDAELGRAKSLTMEVFSVQGISLVHSTG